MEKVGIRVFLLFVFISILLLFLDSRRQLVFVRDVSSYVVSPMYRVTSSIRDSFNDSFSFVTFWKSGEQRIKNLEERNLELLVSASKANTLERENKELRAQLGVTDFASQKLIPAKVLGKNRYLVIDVGTSDGVSNGQTVIYKDSLVGKIIKTSSKLSHVQLPTDINSKIASSIEKSGTVRGLVVGQFNSSMIMDQVVQTEQMPIEKPIFTSGVEGNYEPHLLIGKVGKTVSKESDLFKKAEVKPILNYDKLETVFVIAN